MRKGRLFLLIIAFLVLQGCASTRYIEKVSDTSPDLQMSARNDHLDLSLNNVLTPNGPGSWIKDAKWDEYVVIIRNQAGQPVTIEKISLVDPRGVYLDAGTDFIALEKTSDTLAGAYKDSGIKFTAQAVPTAVEGAGTVALATGAVGSIFLAPVAILGAPALYFGNRYLSDKDRESVAGEFNRRRLANGTTISDKSTITGSLFFPMVPNPQALIVKYQVANTVQTVELKTDKLQGIHVTAAAAGRQSEPAKESNASR